VLSAEKRISMYYMLFASKLAAYVYRVMFVLCTNPPRENNEKVLGKKYIAFGRGKL